MFRFCAFALALVATPAFAANYIKISDKAEFVRLVKGKTLTQPLVKLEVSSAGRITGKGASWDVNGKWTWQNGYFCWNLN